MNKKRENPRPPFNYVDLFAGIGGFHQAMRYLNGTCVFASEIDPDCQKVYKLNFKNTPLEGDIRNCDVPNSEYTVLCAGFPCQPFSKAGQQKGFNDEGRGDLFFEVMRFIRANPKLKFIILENVRNLADKKENWNVIITNLKNSGFVVTDSPLILSPTDFGIPQYRERVFILGIKSDIVDLDKCPEMTITRENLNFKRYLKDCKTGRALDYLIEDSETSLENYKITEDLNSVLLAWEEFRLSTFVHRFGAPVWICAFGLGIDDDSRYKVEVGYSFMPSWKQRFYDKNRALYLNHRDYIDSWIKKYDMLSKTKLCQKFEWNCGDDDISIYDTIIQVRQSGIRCKRQDYFPSLVAISNIPIIWDSRVQYFRYITPKEASNLQSFHKRFKLVGDDKTLYKQLGNSVNVRILKILGECLFNLERKE